MEGNLNGYDANDWEPGNDFAPLPEGDYKSCIVESAFKPTKKGDGQYLELKIQVIDGPCNGRLLFDRLNLQNPNGQAEEIAKRTLSSICRAVGKMTPQDSSELHNIPMLVRVSVEPRSDTGEPSNRVKSYKSLKPAEPSEPAPRPTPPARTEPARTASSPGGGKKAPWAR